MKRVPAVLMLLIIVLLLVAGFVAIKHFALAPQPEYLQGQIEARRVMVAESFPGASANLPSAKETAFRKALSSPKFQAPKSKRKRCRPKRLQGGKGPGEQGEKRCAFRTDKRGRRP